MPFSDFQHYVDDLRSGRYVFPNFSNCPISCIYLRHYKGIAWCDTNQKGKYHSLCPKIAIRKRGEESRAKLVKFCKEISKEQKSGNYTPDYREEWIHSREEWYAKCRENPYYREYGVMESERR